VRHAQGRENTERERCDFADPQERTPTILLVDDEMLLRMGISDFLQQCGFRVLAAGSAAEAIQCINAYPNHIDLVFSDVRMPGEMDGFGLAQWVRKNRPGLPVLLCSGDSKKAAAAEEICADEPFLKKPFDLQMMVAKIRQMLDRAKTQH
jgi:DNA-binding NtrC family response regulator